MPRSPDTPFSTSTPQSWRPFLCFTRFCSSEAMPLIMRMFQYTPKSAQTHPALRPCGFYIYVGRVDLKPPFSSLFPRGGLSYSIFACSPRYRALQLAIYPSPPPTSLTSPPPTPIPHRYSMVRCATVHELAPAEVEIWNFVFLVNRFRSHLLLLP